MATTLRDSPIPAAPAPAPGSGAEERQLALIAENAVELAALGPRLARLAAEMETQARTQAQRAATMAGTMAGLAGDLEQAVDGLHVSSGQMRQALRTVERIAEQTQLLSINASIEAARAGVHGRAFAVVVDEVKQLADRTGRTTVTIAERMEELGQGIGRVAAVSRADAADALGATRTVAALNHEVRGVNECADRQLGSAESVHTLSGQIRALTEALLLAVGKFRFEAHGRAQRMVDGLRSDLVAGMGQRGRLEQAIARWLEEHPSFEVAYLTDPAGRQVVDNLVRQGDGVARDPSGYGRDWSERPWYRDAVRCAGVCSTDIYRSSATGDFCFTVALGLRDGAGALLGVFGSDVNFHKLVGE